MLLWISPHENQFHTGCSIEGHHKNSACWSWWSFSFPTCTYACKLMSCIESSEISAEVTVHKCSKGKCRGAFARNRLQNARTCIKTDDITRQQLKALEVNYHAKNRIASLPNSGLNVSFGVDIIHISRSSHGLRIRVALQQTYRKKPLSHVRQAPVPIVSAISQHEGNEIKWRYPQAALSPSQSTRMGRCPAL